MQKYTLNDLSKLLTEKRINPTHQRLVVLKHLIEKKNHPSVETIYEELVEEIPTLSKTTVYNTFKLLSDKNIVSALSINTSEILYDFIVNPHAHFKCVKCGIVLDIVLNAPIADKPNINGHLILDAQINYKGKCSSCK
ncbi:MAG: transcriptional repressor [Melioribacteraceae bacterium]|nr:transcriptional repressor [Melioribacteraceae bacterium]